MVNSGFPFAAHYGFEMVDGRSCDPFRSNARDQSKIYAESSRSNFSRIRRDLTSMQTLAIYRHLLGKDGEIKTPQAENADGINEMFFLLRLTFWIGLVLVLLPRDKTPDSDKTPPINASEAVSAATAAVTDMSQFCKRQPTACEVGGQAATVIGQRAQAGAKKLYQIITDKRSPDHTGSIGNTESGGAALQAAITNDTLTPEDTQIEWLGPQAPLP